MRVAVVGRHRVQARERARDDGAVERLEPRLVADGVESDRPGGDDGHGPGQRVGHPSGGKDVVHAYIVGAWKTKASSDSSTSTWIPT